MSTTATPLSAAQAAATAAKNIEDIRTGSSLTSAQFHFAHTLGYLAGVRAAGVLDWREHDALYDEATAAIDQWQSPRGEPAATCKAGHSPQAGALAGADKMADREITPGMTADDWRAEGYEAGRRGHAYEAGPHDQSDEVRGHWDGGYYAGQADLIAEEGK